MKKLWILFAAATALLSCTKLEHEETALCKIGFDAQMPGSKASIEGLTPIWDPTDAISVFGPSGCNSRFSISSCTGGNAHFVGSSDPEGPYCAIFPYSESHSFSANSLTSVLPSVQHAGEGNIDPQALFMLANCANPGSQFNFRNLCGLLRITIDIEGISSITVTSADGSKLAGEFKTGLDLNVSSTAKASPSVTLLPQGKSFAPGVYFIGVLPCAASGVTMSLGVGEGGKAYIAKSAKYLNLSRSGMKNLGTASEIVNSSNTFLMPATAGNNVIAHRGGSTEAGTTKYPDNSRAALRYAISLGCYGSECDIYWTKDDKVVVAHAANTYYVNGLEPWNHTLEELRQAGSLKNGEQLPSLEEYIDLVMNKGLCTKLVLDIKALGTYTQYPIEAARRACEIITEKKARHWCMFICTGNATVMKSADVYAKNAGVEIGWMGNQSAATYKSKGYVWANLPAVTAMSPASGGTGSRTLEEFEDAGIELSVFALDSKSGYSGAVYSDTAKAYYKANYKRFKAITTNYPKWLINYLAD